MLSNQVEIHNENEDINLTPSNGSKVRKKSIADRRRVHFPEDDSIIIGCLEPFHPTPDNCTSEELVAAYIASCKLYKTPTIDFLLEQLRGIDLSICNERYSRLCLKGFRLNRYQVETLEEVFRRVHFQDLDMEDTYLDEASAIALFDMMLHYETCVDLSISLSLEKSTSSVAWTRCITYLRKSGVLRRFKLSHTPLTAQLFNGLSFSGLSLTTLTFQDCSLTGASLQCLLRLLRYLMTYTAASAKSSSVGSGGPNSSRYPRPSYRGPIAPVPWGLTLRLPDNRINALDAESLLLLVRHQLVMLPGPPTPDPSDSPTETCVPTNRPAGGSGYLEELDLSHNLLRDEGVKVLCAGLYQAYQLQQQRLEVALKAIAEASSTADRQRPAPPVRSLPPRGALPRTCGLRRLGLADNGLTGDAGARYLAAVLACATERMAPLLGGLSALDLSDNPGLGDAGLVALCQGLIRNFTLKQLILRNVRMRFNGVFALSGYVGETRTLEQLDIRQNVVDVAGVMALTRTLKVNHSLHSLLMDVRSSNLPPSEEFEIVRIFLKEMEEYLRRNLNSHSVEVLGPSSPEAQVAKEVTEEVLSSSSLQTAVDRVPSTKLADDLIDQVGEQAAVEIKEILLDPPRHSVSQGESMLFLEEREEEAESPEEKSSDSEEIFAPAIEGALDPATKNTPENHVESCKVNNAVYVESAFEVLGDEPPMGFETFLDDINTGNVPIEVKKSGTLEIDGNGRNDGVEITEVGVKKRQNTECIVAADGINLCDSFEIVSSSTLEVCEPRVVSEVKDHDLNSYSANTQTTVVFDRLDEDMKEVEFDSNFNDKDCPKIKGSPLIVEEGLRIHGLNTTSPETAERRSSDIYNSEGFLEMCEPNKGPNNEGSRFSQDNEVKNFFLRGINADDDGIVSIVDRDASPLMDKNHLESILDLGGDNCSVDAQLLEPSQLGVECVSFKEPQTETASECKCHYQENVEDRGSRTETFIMEEAVEVQDECKRVSEGDFTIQGIETDVLGEPESVSDKEAVEDEFSSFERNFCVTVEMFSPSTLDIRELRNQSDGHATQGSEKSEATVSDSRKDGETKRLPKSELVNHELYTKVIEKYTIHRESLDGSEAAVSTNWKADIGTSGNEFAYNLVNLESNSRVTVKTVSNSALGACEASKEGSSVETSGTEDFRENAKMSKRYSVETITDVEGPTYIDESGSRNEYRKAMEIVSESPLEVNSAIVDGKCNSEVTHPEKFEGTIKRIPNPTVEIFDPKIDEEVFTKKSSFRRKEPHCDDSKPDLLASFYGNIQHSEPEATSDVDSCGAVPLDNIEKTGLEGIAPFIEAEFLCSQAEIGLEPLACVLPQADEEGRGIMSSHLEVKQSEICTNGEVISEESENSVNDYEWSALEQPGSNSQSPVLSNVIRGSLEGQKKGTLRGEDETSLLDQSSSENFAHGSVGDETKAVEAEETSEFAHINQQITKSEAGLVNFTDLNGLRLQDTNETENRIGNNWFFNEKSNFNAESEQQETPVVVTESPSDVNQDDLDVSPTYGGCKYLSKDAVEFHGIACYSEMQTAETHRNCPGKDIIDVQLSLKHLGKANAANRSLEIENAPIPELDGNSAWSGSTIFDVFPDLENVRACVGAKIEVSEDQVIDAEHLTHSQAVEKSNMDSIESGFMGESLSLKVESSSKSLEEDSRSIPDRPEAKVVYAQPPGLVDYTNPHETAEPERKIPSDKKTNLESSMKSKRKGSWDIHSRADLYQHRTPSETGSADPFVKTCPRYSVLWNNNEEEQESSSSQIRRRINPASLPRPTGSSGEWKVDDWPELSLPSEKNLP